MLTSSQPCEDQVVDGVLEQQGGGDGGLASGEDCRQHHLHTQRSASVRYSPKPQNGRADPFDEGRDVEYLAGGGLARDTLVAAQAVETAQSSAIQRPGGSGCAGLACQSRPQLLRMRSPQPPSRCGAAP